jgi:hypothetical protein
VRGEVPLRLPSAERILRPTFAALVAAETEVGSLLGLLDRAGAGDLRLGDMGPLLWHSLMPDDGVPDRGAFEDELLQIGLAGLVGAYRQLLAAIFRSRA